MARNNAEEYIKRKARDPLYLAKMRERQWRQYMGAHAPTLADYDRMLAEQGGRCGLCAKAPAKGKVLCVDHDHVSGAVRGLLCYRCNALLGLVENDPEMLGKIDAWLRRTVA